MLKYPSVEELKLLKEYQDIITGQSEPTDLMNSIILTEYITPRMKKLQNIYYKDTNENIPFLFFDAYYSDNEIATEHYNYLLNFCIYHKIKFYSMVSFLLGWEFNEIKRIKNKKIKILNKISTEYYNQYRNLTKTEFIEQMLNKLSDIYENMSILDIAKNSKVYQQILENSFDEIKNRVKNNIYDIDLPLEQYSIEKEKVLEEIENQKEYCASILNHKNSLIQINQDNHFLSYLKNDTLNITDDYKVVFSGHTEGFSLGYTDKAILLSLDKRSTVRELEIKLKHLSHFDEDGTNEFTLLAKALLEFISQNKAYSNYVPYKSLAKIMGISKNKVKRYAKEFVGISEKSFMDNFEKIKTHTK